MLRRTLLATPLAIPALVSEAGAQAPIAMTIATGVDPSFAPFYVAREAGIFTRNGLNVTVNTGPSGSAMVAFLVGNQINAAYGAEQAGVSAHLVDPNIVAVAEGTALLRWISILARGIENMDGLKGKRIGVARGTGSETFWLSVISRLNLNAADYTVVNVEAPEMVAALERGNIDAFAVWEPWPTRAMRAIPNTRIILSNDAIQVVRNFVYMNKGWAEQNVEATTRFMKSMVEAQQFIAAQPAEAAGHVARFLRQDRALMAELMTKVEFTMNLTPDSVANIQLAIDQLRGMNRLSRPVTPSEVIWREPLARADAARVRLG